MSTICGLSWLLIFYYSDMLLINFIMLVLVQFRMLFKNLSVHDVTELFVFFSVHKINEIKLSYN